MPTLNIKLTTNGENLPFDTAVRGRVRVGDLTHWHQETPDRASYQHFTDEAGAVALENLPNGTYRVWALAEGFVPIADAAQDIALHAGDNPQVEIAMRAVGVEAGPLHNEGIDLVTDTGKPWQFRGYHIHLALNVIKNGGDFGALLDEAIGYGANTIVAIGNHLSPWKDANGFHLDASDPGHMDLLAQYFEACAARKIRGFLYALADAQTLSEQEQRRLWYDACDVAHSRWNAFLCPMNEAPYNGGRPETFDLPDLGGVLAARPSMGENAPCYFPEWQINLWESRRGPIYKALDDAGAGILELQHGYTASDGRQIGPFRNTIWDIEPWAFNDVTPDRNGDSRVTDDRLALLQGLEMAPNCGGGGFLATEGMEGRPLGPVAAQCARQFFRGLRAGFLR